MTQIVVIGHSLGANAANRYAVSHGPLAAVVAIAPGHVPRPTTCGNARTTRDRGGAADSQRARRRPSLVPDAIQSITMAVTATPSAYLSMIDPRWPAVIRRMLPRCPPFRFCGSPANSTASPHSAAICLRAGGQAPKSRYVKSLAAISRPPGWRRPTILAWLRSL